MNDQNMRGQTSYMQVGRMEQDRGNRLNCHKASK